MDIWFNTVRTFTTVSSKLKALVNLWPNVRPRLHAWCVPTKSEAEAAALAAQKTEGGGGSRKYLLQCLLLVPPPRLDRDKTKTDDAASYLYLNNHFLAWKYHRLIRSIPLIYVGFVSKLEKHCGGSWESRLFQKRMAFLRPIMWDEAGRMPLKNVYAFVAAILGKRGGFPRQNRSRGCSPVSYSARMNKYPANRAKNSF